MLLLQRGQDFGHLSVCAKSWELTGEMDGSSFSSYSHFWQHFTAPSPFYLIAMQVLEGQFSFFFSFSKNKLDSLSVKMSDLERKSAFAKKKPLMRSKKY